MNLYEKWVDDTYKAFVKAKKSKKYYIDSNGKIGETCNIEFDKDNFTPPDKYCLERETKSLILFAADTINELMACYSFFRKQVEEKKNKLFKTSDPWAHIDCEHCTILNFVVCNELTKEEAKVRAARKIWKLT